MKRIKWEPFALMVLLLLLGAWLVARPSGLHAREGARTLDLKIGTARGIVEVYTPPLDTPTPTISTAPIDDQTQFRVLLRNGFVSPIMTSAEFKARYGEELFTTATGSSDNYVFRLLNITTWTSLIWVVIGFGGQFAFTGRMLIQWFISEKRKESVIPEAFWWLSLIGGLALFAYFVWRQDIVAVLGQSSGVVIYARNLRLIYKQRRKLRQSGAEPAPAPTPPSQAPST